MMTAANDRTPRIARTCDRCQHWFRGQNNEASEPPGAPSSVGNFRGTCQLVPPVVTDEGNLWPITHYSRTCGQWAPDVADEPKPAEAVPDAVVVPLREVA